MRHLSAHAVAGGDGVRRGAEVHHARRIELVPGYVLRPRVAEAVAVGAGLLDRVREIAVEADPRRRDAHLVALEAGAVRRRHGPAALGVAEGGVVDRVAAPVAAG